LLFKTAGPFGLVISSQSFVKRQRGGDLYLGGRVLLMFCWMKSDTTALPSISKSSWAFSVYCWSVSSPAAWLASSALWMAYKGGKRVAKLQAALQRVHCAVTFS
jgi:hypothetical protein